MRYLTCAFILICLVSCLSLTAQTIINPKIGLNYSRLADEPSLGSAKTRSGFNIGADLRFGDRFQFMPGVHYATHGMAFEGTQDPNSEDKISMHLIKVPLTGNINVINGDLFKLRVYGGFVANFLLKVDNNNYIEKENLKPFTGGIRFGTGIDLGGLTLDLNYEVGVTDVFDGGIVPELLYPKNTQNNVISLSVGVRVNR